MSTADLKKPDSTACPTACGDRRRPLRSRGGFTLIEMLVVMSVLALLLTLALPRYIGVLDRSRDTVLRENLRVLRITLDQFHGDRGRYPESLQELVALRYLHAVPVDPVTRSSRSWVLIAPRDGQGAGVADVRSGAQGQTEEGQAYESL